MNHLRAINKKAQRIVPAKCASVNDANPNPIGIANRTRAEKRHQRLPTRNSEVFGWCLGQGLRVTQPMTLMSLGLYNEPRGAFLPSILF